MAGDLIPSLVISHKNIAKDFFAITANHTWYICFFSLNCPVESIVILLQGILYSTMFVSLIGGGLAYLPMAPSPFISFLFYNSYP